MALIRCIATYLNPLLRRTVLVPSSMVKNLRLAFLIPLAVASILFLGIWITSMYLHERDMIENESARTRILAKKMYADEIAHDARMLDAAMSIIIRDGAMRALLAARDRAALLKRSTPLLNELQRRFGITHLYFSGPDRVNLLRVHQPQRYGDVIQRFTTLEAERTARTAYGVELGPLGTLTLRLVTPWYADKAQQRLIGYVELGMEIDPVWETVQKFTGTPVLVFVSKQYLRREDWEAGMKMLGRNPQWDRFRDFVLSNDAATEPEQLLGQFAAALQGATPANISPATAHERVEFLPLTDAAGRAVGRIGLLIDNASHTSASHRIVLIGISSSVLILGLLIGFIYLFAGRIEQRIKHDEEMLQQLAEQDGLTGLYNQRTFYVLLANEFTRAQRFNRSVSLLLLDIDHFKSVNDTYGHLAGDAILKELSQRLRCQVRAIDSICRYGGEEITIILPESNLEVATHMAERIRAAVAAHPFDTRMGVNIGITVSIGVASWPAQVDSLQTLVAAADLAMYAAKQGGRNRVVPYAPALCQPA